jgi:hypothetical protein
VLARVAIRKLCSGVVLGSAPIRRRSLTELNVRVLRALEPNRYQTIDAVTELLAVQRFVARAELTRLREQELVEDNGEHPLAFRRTVRGDEALKWFASPLATAGGANPAAVSVELRSPFPISNLQNSTSG